MIQLFIDMKIARKRKFLKCTVIEKAECYCIGVIQSFKSPKTGQTLKTYLPFYIVSQPYIFIKN